MEDPSKWVEEKDYGRDYDLEKHKRERAERGFSEYDWWNFADYIAWVNINALEKFKTGNGYPGDLSSMDEWVAELDIMIDGFKAHFKTDLTNWNNKEEVNRLLAVKDKGLALYAKRFSSLWD